MTQAHQSTSERIGIARDCKIRTSARLSTTDITAVQGNVLPKDATYSSRHEIFSDGTRTVMLVTTGDSHDLRDWQMIESDDPAVGAFIEQFVAVLATLERLYEEQIVSGPPREQSLGLKRCSSPHVRTTPKCTRCAMIALAGL